MKQMIDLLGELPREWQSQWECMQKESKSKLDFNEGKWFNYIS